MFNKLVEFFKKLNLNLTMKKNIVALGGGGFSQTGEVSKIDKYILSLTKKLSKNFFYRYC